MIPKAPVPLPVGVALLLGVDIPNALVCGADDAALESARLEFHCFC